MVSSLDILREGGAMSNLAGYCVVKRVQSASGLASFTSSASEPQREKTQPLESKNDSL